MNAVLVGVGAAALAAVLVALAFHLATSRRITTAAERLQSTDWRLATTVGRSEEDEPRRFDLDPALGRLEKSVDDTVRRADLAGAAVARLGAALEAVPQGVVLADDEGREVFRNAVARAYAGARHGEALVEQVVREQLAAATDGSTAQRSLDLFGPPRRMLVISSMPLGDACGSPGGLVVIDDVSERRRLEAVRRDFVANISHELKTPVGALGLLAEAIASEDDPAVHQRLSERMTSEAHRVGRIIDDLLDLSRIEAEEGPVREPVSVQQVVAEAVDRVRPMASARGIRIAVDEVPGRHTVRGDHRQLVSAVGNLLENACKYSDDASTVEIRSRADAESVEIDVCDHGVGIPTRDLERVFERFYRVDRARSRETGGTGLGLSIVRHVAGNHRGEVRVQSREGEGSVFTLRLPSGTNPDATVVTIEDDYDYDDHDAEDDHLGNGQRTAGQGPGPEDDAATAARTGVRST